jgi:hypothetical protein
MRKASTRDAARKALQENPVMPSNLLRRLPVLALAFLLAAPAFAVPLGSTFTYQGDLELSGSPVTGNYDFTFKLYNAASSGTQVGTTQSVLNLAVTRGLFTTPLDFGTAPFDGSALWLEIGVRTAGGASYTTLAPRQAITATPYALRALNGPSGSSQWNNDANGIDYTGRVGIGGASTVNSRLEVSSNATDPENPIYIHSANPSYATLYFANLAGGTGLYDAASGTHYLQGKLGVGLFPANAKLEVSGAGNGLWVTTGGYQSNPHYNAAIVGLGTNGTPPPLGTGAPAMGVYASSVDNRAMWGISVNNLGVVGDCQAAGNTGWMGGLTEGVYGQATKTTSYGARFTNTAVGGVALRVDGLQQVKTLQILGGADLAERFDVEGSPEPGTVLRIDESKAGALRVCDEAYSARVAGVVSGAHDLAAGIELGKGEAAAGSVAVALSGRVWVKCDATAGAIRAGDLLTTSARPGHAMRATNRDRAQGAILGKAMTSLEAGTGLVLVLVSLQ